MTLTPLIATLIFCATCLAGVSYRRVWKLEGPTYQLWFYGLVAAGGLLVLAFVPLQIPGS